MDIAQSKDKPFTKTPAELCVLALSSDDSTARQDAIERLFTRGIKTEEPIRLLLIIVNESQDKENQTVALNYLGKLAVWEKPGAIKALDEIGLSSRQKLEEGSQDTSNLGNSDSLITPAQIFEWIKDSPRKLQDLIVYLSEKKAIPDEIAAQIVTESFKLESEQRHRALGAIAALHPKEPRDFQFDAITLLTPGMNSCEQSLKIRELLKIHVQESVHEEIKNRAAESVADALHAPDGLELVSKHRVSKYLIDQIAAHVRGGKSPGPLFRIAHDINAQNTGEIRNYALNALINIFNRLEPNSQQHEVLSQVNRAARERSLPIDRRIKLIETLATKSFDPDQAANAALNLVGPNKWERKSGYTHPNTPAQAEPEISVKAISVLGKLLVGNPPLGDSTKAAVIAELRSHRQDAGLFYQDAAAALSKLGFANFPSAMVDFVRRKIGL